MLVNKDIYFLKYDILPHFNLEGSLHKIAYEKISTTLQGKKELC